MEQTESSKISRMAKSMATKAGVKTRIKSHYKSVRVTFLTEPTQELVSRIIGLETAQAYGDAMNDTRRWSGIHVWVVYEFEVTEDHKARYSEIKNRWGDHGPNFEKDVIEKMGPAGSNLLAKGYK